MAQTCLTEEWYIQEMVCVNGLKVLVDSLRPTWKCCVLMRAPFVVAVADGSKFKPLLASEPFFLLAIAAIASGRTFWSFWSVTSSGGEDGCTGEQGSKKLSIIVHGLNNSQNGESPFLEQQEVQVPSFLGQIIGGWWTLRWMPSSGLAWWTSYVSCQRVRFTWAWWSIYKLKLYSLYVTEDKMKTNKRDTKKSLAIQVFYLGCWRC